MMYRHWQVIGSRKWVPTVEMDTSGWTLGIGGGSDSYGINFWLAIGPILFDIRRNR